jgi:hypothetical protein
MLFCFGLLAMLNLGAALWFFQQKSEPDWNFISVTLTIFEILLAGALIGGFWMLRGAAETRAAAEAREVATKVASEEARKSAIAWLELYKVARGDQDNDSTDLEDMINSLDSKNGEGEE